MCGLLVKCGGPIVMIHGFRVLGRLAGPRWTGWRSDEYDSNRFHSCGSGKAVRPQLPWLNLASWASPRPWPCRSPTPARFVWLAGLASLAAAVAGYFVVARASVVDGDGAVFGSVSHSSPFFRHSFRGTDADSGVNEALAHRFRISGHGCPYGHSSDLRLVLGVAQRVAGPGWAGLVSTFPSMSLVVLAVTHLRPGQPRRAGSPRCCQRATRVPGASWRLFVSSAQRSA